MRRQHHIGFGARNALDKPDRPNQFLERRRIVGFDLEQKSMLAGHVMAFQHIIEKINRFLEKADRFGMTDRYSDERGHVLAEQTSVDRGLIAGDYSTVFKFLDAFDYRRRRQPYLLTQLHMRNPPMLLQDRDNLEVDVIKFHGAVSLISEGQNSRGSTKIVKTHPSGQVL